MGMQSAAGSLAFSGQPKRRFWHSRRNFFAIGIRRGQCAAGQSAVTPKKPCPLNQIDQNSQDDLGTIRNLVSGRSCAVAKHCVAAFNLALWRRCFLPGMRRRIQALRFSWHNHDPVSL
jgi:hypothetical protein